MAGEYTQVNKHYNLSESYDPGISLEFGVKRTKDVIKFSIGLIDDEFSTSFWYQEPIELGNGRWVQADRGRVGSTNYQLAASIGYASRHLHDAYFLLPLLTAELQFLYHIGSRYSSGLIQSVLDDPSTTLLTEYSSFDRRVTPFLLLGGSYDVFGKQRISIPISFGYRIPVFRRYQYSDGFVSIDDGPVVFERVEKTGRGRYLTIGVKYALRGR